MMLSVKLFQVEKPTKEAFLEISDSCQEKVDAIIDAGFQFEGEYSGLIGVTTTITGENADHAIALSTDPGDREGHRAKVEEMIANFDIHRMLKADAEAA